MNTWKPGLFLIVIFASLFAVIPQATAYCAIATNYGMAPDYDCDGVIDDLDNCQSVNNADQRDMNRNGIGDVCDLLIEEIVVNPDNHLRQGEIAHVTVRIVNSYEAGIGDITINVKNSELGIDASQALPYLPRGETAALDFWIVIPKCAKVKTYDLSVSAIADGSTETQKQSVVVDKGDVCGTPSGPLDYTIVNVFNQADIDRGEDVIIPVKIINLGDNQATYDLAVNDLGNWGTWRIDPNPRMTLAAGHADTAYLYIQSERVDAGVKTVELTVTSGKQKTTVPIDLYVRVPKEKAAVPWGFLLLQIIFIIILLALIIAVIVIALRKPRKASGSEPDMSTKSVPRKTVKIEDAEKKKLETYY
jgi:hypothetical protein